MSFTATTAIITGASRGIGLAAAKKFLSEGWRVIATARIGALPIQDGNLSVVALDYGREGSIARAAEEIRHLAGNIDVLVNNSGILVREGKETVDVGVLRGTLEVNLFGTIGFTEKLVPSIARGGHIVNITSNAAAFDEPLRERESYPEYRISKTAENMYTRVLASRLAKSGVTVSSLDPGWVRTEMGGEDAPRSPEEAAEDIYNLAVAKVPTGKFWLKGKERAW